VPVSQTTEQMPGTALSKCKCDILWFPIFRGREQIRIPAPRFSQEHSRTMVDSGNFNLQSDLSFLEEVMLLTQDDSTADLSFLEELMQLTQDDGTVDELPPDFMPGNWDVICQRGKECFDHGKSCKYHAPSTRYALSLCSF
jgi:hypothetical protein